jgi:hypothetical protein
MVVLSQRRLTVICSSLPQPFLGARAQAVIEQGPPTAILLKA